MNSNQPKRDHGGGLDAAITAFGGSRASWLDLSTGINPTPYPLPPLPLSDWTDLPDQAALDALVDAARAFWSVPAELAILPVPGVSAAIALIPRLADTINVWIPQPTYNEHAASFVNEGWVLAEDATGADACVVVNPNNPDGRLWTADHLCGSLKIVDESFCDVTPDATLLSAATRPGTLILKSFGKFWGLAGARLGFVIGDLTLIHKLAQLLGPWAVSGPALRIGTAALQDKDWAEKMRAQLVLDAARLDELMIRYNAESIGGTSLFRLYDVADASAFQQHLAQHHIWSRIFPYNRRWLRLGVPDSVGLARLKTALA